MASLLFIISPQTVSAEHATCTEEEPEFCGAFMNWEYIFQDTPVRGADTEDVMNIPSPDIEENMMRGVGLEYRNLYHGITTLGDENVQDMATGQDAFSDNHWLEGEESFRPLSLSSEFQPSWVTLVGSDEVTSTHEDSEYVDTVVLQDGVTEAEFSTWEEEVFGFIQTNEALQEDGWDHSRWPLHENDAEFIPTSISINTSLPEGSNMRFEIYEPVDSSELRNGDPEEYKLGYVELDGDERGSPDTPVPTTGQILHGDDEPGLEEYFVPRNVGENNNGIYTTTNNNEEVRTYHIRAVIERDNEDVSSPEMTIDQPIELSEPLSDHRLGNDPWFGYPASLPSLDRIDDADDVDEFERGDRFEVTSSRADGFSDDFVIGHTETMIQNFREIHIEGTGEDTSVAPQIPRDGDPADRVDEFYHGSAIGTPEDNDALYHVMSNENGEDVNNQIFFHHVYTDLPRVEMSTYYQDDYSRMSDFGWNTVVSDDGVLYAITDGAVNEIDYHNTNYRGESHEEDNDWRQYENDFSSSGGELDLPNYSQSSFSTDDLETNAIRMSYTVDNFEIMPEIGGRYSEVDTEPSGFFSGLFTFPENIQLEEPEYIEPRDFILDYTKDDIEEEEPSGNWEFESFYSNIINVTVTYEIDYERLRYTDNSCPAPDVLTESNVNRYSSDHPNCDEPHGGCPYREGEVRSVSGTPLLDEGNVDDVSSSTSGVYSTYDGWSSAEYDESIRTDSDADGRASCEAESDRYISGTTWDNTDWDFAEDHVWHDDGDSVTFNATDDGVGAIVGGEEEEEEDDDGFWIFGGEGGDSEFVPDIDEDRGPSFITASEYQVDTFASDLMEQRDTDEEFTAELALGNREFESRTYFDRDEDGTTPENTRWTRGEATALMERGTAIMDQDEDTYETSISVPYDHGLEGTFNEPEDTTHIEPIQGEVTEDIDVTLDIYNYGPSLQDPIECQQEPCPVQGSGSSDSIDIMIEGELIEDNVIFESSPDHSGYNHEGSFDITDEAMGQDTIELEIEYDGGEESAQENLPQRTDYVVTYETDHPVEGMSSRWAYNTFRDTRYDMAYEFESSDCVIDPELDCYDYNNHTYPFISLDGEPETFSEVDMHSNQVSVQEDPTEDNPIQVHYPSNAMISNPYLMPTSRDIQTRGPNSRGHMEVKPVRSTTNYLEEEGIQSDNQQDQTGVTLESEGTFRVVELGGTIMEPEDPSTPSGQSVELVSIDLHDFYSDAAADDNQEPGFDLDYWGYDNFPAMMQHPSDDWEDNFDWRDSLLPDNTDVDDVMETHDVWFEDGRVRVNATLEDSEYYDDLAIEDVTFVVMDFPPSFIEGWQDWEDLESDDDFVDTGFMFGGYEFSNYDEMRRHELTAEEGTALGDIFDFDLDELIEAGGDGATIEGTYVEQEDSWIVTGEDAQNRINSAESPMFINSVEWYPPRHDRCALDTTRDERYCTTKVFDLANYNLEEAHRQFMPYHMDQYEPPLDRTPDEMPFVEHTEFEVVGYTDAYASWNIAADASWETAPIQDDNTDRPKLFDGVQIDIQPISNVTESLSEEDYSNLESSGVEHQLVTEDEVDDSEIQQFRLTVTDAYDTPIDFSTRGYSIPEDPNGDVFNREEGVCIHVEEDGRIDDEIGNTERCFATDQDGELYFTLETANLVDEDADSLDMEIEVIGSEDEWWEYPDGMRLIESASTSYSSTDALEGRDSGEGADNPLLAIIVVLLIFLYVLSMAMRIRTNPNNGPTTTDLIGIMSEPFIKEPFRRLMKFLMYLIVYIIGLSVVLAAMGGDINPFFIIDAIITPIWEELMSIIF